MIPPQGQGADAKDSPAVSHADEESKGPEQDAQLRSMIESTGQLDIDERGYLDFHGGSSGAVFIRRMRERFGDLLGDNLGSFFLPRLPRPKALDSLYTSPRLSSIESPLEMNIPNTIDLPSREVAKILCHDSLNCACALLRFIHQPTFYKMFDRIYDIPPEHFGDEENRFLPLLYVVLALGCMFNGNSPHNMEAGRTQNSYQISISQG